MRLTEASMSKARKAAADAYVEQQLYGFAEQTVKMLKPISRVRKDGTYEVIFRFRVQPKKRSMT